MEVRVHANMIECGIVRGKLRGGLRTGQHSCPQQFLLNLPLQQLCHLIRLLVDTLHALLTLCIFLERTER
jgi:hypothetical protein